MAKNDDWRSHSSVLSDFMRAANELIRHPEASDCTVNLVGPVLRFMEDESDRFASNLDNYEFPEELDDLNETGLESA